jgi:hypothetical protein
MEGSIYALKPLGENSWLLLEKSVEVMAWQTKPDLRVNRKLKASAQPLRHG